MRFVPPIWASICLSERTHTLDTFTSADHRRNPDDQIAQLFTNKVEWDESQPKCLPIFYFFKLFGYFAALQPFCLLGRCFKLLQRNSFKTAVTELHLQIRAACNKLNLAHWNRSFFFTLCLNCTSLCRDPSCSLWGSFWQEAPCF